VLPRGFAMYGRMLRSAAAGPPPGDCPAGTERDELGDGNSASGRGGRMDEIEDKGNHVLSVCGLPSCPPSPDV
jgi:hypothetical protein